MTFATAAAPSSAHAHHAGHTATRAISRLIALVAPMLAMASVTPAPAAADGPVFRQSADTLSVTLTAPAGGTVTEGDTAQFTLAVGGKAGSGDVTVRYTVSGTATPGEDYEALPGEVTLAGGARSAAVALVAASDSIADGGETVILTLTSGTGPGTVVVDGTPATVTISDPRDTRDPTDNQPPQANAGLDETVDERTLVNLDGSGSQDDDSDFITFAWTQTVGPDVDLVGANSQFASFAAPDVTRANSPLRLTFRLTVRDDGFNSDSDLVTVTVNHVNRAPDCAGIGDQSVYVGDRDSVSCTDLDEDTLRYTVTSSDENKVSVSGGSEAAFEGLDQGEASVTLVATDPEGAADTTTFAVTVPNRDPTARAGSDQDLNERTRVDLDGTRSSDPDGDSLRYSWRRTAGPAVTLHDANTATPYFTPKVTADANITFELEVDDNKGGTDTDRVTITVRDVNRDPTARAGDDQDVNERTRVDLDGTRSSDPDGDSLRYSWRRTAGPAVTLHDANTATPYFTPEVTADAGITFELEVDDNKGGTHTDRVTITVRDVNRQPTARAGSDETVNERTRVDLNGTRSSDPDDDTLDYSWRRISGPAVTLHDANTATPYFTPEVTADAGITFELEVDDNKGGTHTDRVTITVRDVNRQPTARAGSDETVNERTRVDLNGTSSSDPDDDTLDYSWRRISGPAVTLHDANTATPYFTPEVTADATITFELEVDDNKGGTDTDRVTITVRDVNRDPTARAGDDQDVNERTRVDLNGTSSSDPDDDTLDYSWRWISGPAVTLHDANTATPYFTPEVTADAGITFELEVDDNKGGTDTDRVTITVRDVNRDPTARAGDDQDVNERTRVDLNGTSSSDPDDDTLDYSWRWISGPAVTLHDANTATPYFTPEVTADAGITFELEVDDNKGGTHTDRVTITVRDVNRQPTARAGSDETVNERTRVDLNGTSSSDPDDDTLDYSWRRISGPAVTLHDANTATPYFTPEVTADAGITFELEVDDNKGGTHTDRVRITVRDVNRAPTAGAGSDQSVNERTTVTLQGSGTDADSDALSYAWLQTAGPPATLSDTSAASPTFEAPEVTAATALTFRLTVSDNHGGTDTDDVTVTVGHVNRRPAAAAGPDQAVEERTTVTLDGSGSTDPDGGTLSYAWLQTAGPTATLSDTSAASPTFEAPEVTEATDLTFRLTVSDGTLSATDDVTITVAHVNRGPVPAGTIGAQSVDVGGSGSVDVSGYFSDADGDALTYTAEWTDSTAVTVSVTGSLVEYTGDAAGSADVTVTARDPGGEEATQMFTVTVSNGVPTADAGPDQTVDERTTVTLDGSGSTDPDGGTLSYAWLQTAGPTATLSDTSAASPTFEAPEVTAATDLTFRLTVSDGTVSATDEVMITVAHVNRSPVPAGTIAAQSVAVGGSGSVDASRYFSDADGDALTYTAEWTDSTTVTVSVTGSLVEYTGDAAGSADVTVTARDPGGEEATQAFTVTVSNGAPTAEAGPDQTVDERTTVTLDGSDSTDPDGGTLSYAWLQTAGPMATLSDTSAASPTFEAPEVTEATALTFRLTVSDGTVSATDEVTIAVAHVNRSPVPAGTIGAQSVVLGGSSSVDVSGYFSDADGDPLTYTAEWTDSTAVTVSVTGSLVEYTGDAAGSADVTVTARDPGGEEATQAFTVTVSSGAPRAEAGPDQTVDERTTVTLDGSDSTDPDGGTLSYAWLQTAGPMATLSDTSAASPTFAAPEVTEATALTFRLTVSDGTVSATDEVMITVAHVNRSPVPEGRIGARWVVLGGSSSVDASRYFIDADGDALTYTAEWTDSTTLTVTVTEGLVEYTGAARGRVEVTVTARDPGGEAAIQMFTVAVLNRPPTADAGSDQTVDERTTVTLHGSGTDADSDPLSYAWLQTAGPAAALSDTSAASPTFEAPEVTEATALTFRLTVSDGALSATDEVTIAVAHVNRAPEPSGTIPVQTLDVGGSGSVVVSGYFTDADADALTYTAVWTDSAAVTVTVTNSLVEYTGDAAGSADVTVTASDTDGAEAEQMFTVTVMGTNGPPAFDPDMVERTLAENSPAETAVGAAVTATDPDDDELEYSLSGASASSFAVGEVTGLITVASGAVLDYESADSVLTVLVVASDGTLSDTAAVTIRLTDADDPGVLRLDQSVARVGMQVTATLSDQDGSRRKQRRWQLSSDGSTGWTDITGATGRFYTPVEAGRGMWLRAVFTYTDGHGPGKQAASAAVRVTAPNVAPEFSPDSVALSVAENSAAGAAVGTVAATDGNEDDLEYSLLAVGDASSFEIGETTGLITVGAGASLDYESGDTELTVEVEASDGMLADTAAVTIAVTDADDPGMATLDAAEAEAGVALTATLTDEDEPDAGMTAVTWQRSADEGVTWTDITGANAPVYTPAQADGGMLLRAVFTYTDGHGPGKRAASAAVPVTARNRPPEFSPDGVALSVAENSPAGTAVGTAVTATDPDDDELAYSLGGPDAATFDIDGMTGQITVASPSALDYESGHTSLAVGVVASDGTLSDTAAVTISVTDADDPGAVTLDAGVARVGMRITATLMDQDGSESAGKTRQWQLSADGGTGWADITGATSRFYTPVAADRGMWLRAVFMYTDGHGPGKRAESASVRVTGPNEAPEFGAPTAALSVAENSAEGTGVGMVTATDGNDDPLEYRFLAGGDASSFAIGETTGAIAVAAGADLNYEGGDTELTVSVVASDGMLSDTVAVTVAVTDEDDPGVVTLDADVARAGMPLTATLADEDEPDAGATTTLWQRSSNEGMTWTDITGADAASYTPGAADEDMLLRAVFTYTDGHGPNKRAESAAVRVTGTNVAPEFGAAAVALSVPENSAADTELGTVAATDGNDDALEYSFTAGGDEASFEIGQTTGLITVGSSANLDYESGDTELTVEVVATDGVLADTAAVTITVTNAEEPGVVTLDASAARVGTALTATLADEDEPDAQTTTVTWQRSSDGTAWTDIADATSETYTPLAADEDMLLRAVFSYTDGHGPNKRAESDAVRVTGTNVAPEFGAAAVSLSVAENAPAGTAVGAAVTATDGNGDDLEYSLAGDDASSFEIGPATGRITVASEASLDYESGNTSLTVSVVASDGMLADTAAVTIAVTDADDPGVVTLDATVARVGVELTAVLMDQDGSQGSGKRRRWQRSSSGGESWTNIAGATSRFYTPEAADEGTLLRAVFTYTDGDGPGKRAESDAVPVVGATTPVLSFGAEAYSVPLGGSADVVVNVSPAATGSLAVGVTVGGAAGETTHTVTFGAGEAQKTLAVSAQGLAAGDTVLVSFGALPTGAVAVAPSEARVIVSEASADMRQRRVVPLTVEYGEPSYTAQAGGAGAGVTVRVSPAADREVLVPVTGTGAGALGPAELGVPATLRFAPGDTARTFTLEAPEGAPGGRLTLAFGELPEGVSAGAVASSVVEIVASAADGARFEESLEVGLAVLGRSVAEGARRAVGGRMAAAMRGGTGSAGGWENRAAGLLGSLAGTGPGLGAAGSHRRPEGGEVLERLLPRVSFSADLGGRREGSAPRFSVWGEGSAQGFRGEPGAVAYDGGMRALALGADARVAPGARVGLSVMRTGGEFDYTSQSLEGTLGHGMTTVHPYLFFQPSAGLGLWAMAGYGTGQVEAAEAGGAMDATLRMISGGARLPLVRKGAFGLGLAGDIFGVRMSAGEDGAEGGATRGRALIEATYAASGLRLGAEAGGRYDAGDADTGAGAEAGASVAYAGSALDLAVNGRMAFGSGGHREWGVALRLAWDPGARGSGLRLAVSPGRGHDRSGMQGLLENGHVARGGTAREQASRVDAELGYGIAAFGNGSLDTFGRLSAREGARTWSLGTGYDIASALRFNLEAMFARNAAGPARRGLRAGLDFRF
ncbi:PKD domain-containing protein [Candidatus Palauibacter sp.]|uniref:PKD domain-containing protein n=1 Tax=Candidatus Palauibacter sp. TaxID=3101350 RepID=UPI003B5B5E66